MLHGVWNLLAERKSFFVQLVLEHLTISFTASLIAIVLGGFIGIYISNHNRSAKIVLAVVNLLYTIPSISMLGFLISLSGIGNTTAIIALTVYALLPMVRNTYTGILSVDPIIIEAARGMGSTDFQILYKIKLPLAMPVVMAGIRSMVVMTLALAGIASFIGAGGLGVAIYRGITTNNSYMTVAGSFLIAILALITDFLLGTLEKSFNYNKAMEVSDEVAKLKTNYKKSGFYNLIKKKKAYFLVAAMIVLALISPLSQAIKGDSKVIHMATKPMTEQYIIGEMLKILIEENTDLKVDITQGVGGGTSNIQPAMEKGEFQIYPEYTGTGWNMVLKRSSLYTEEKFEELQKAYESKFNLKWVGMFGFENSYALSVRSEVAKEYNLKKISDLAAVSDKLVFGAEYDFFEREDGYDPLCKTYNLKFKSTSDMDIGLKYKAIREKKIDVMPIFTTDGMYSTSDLVVLEDDKNFYPSYQCGNVVSQKLLKEYPKLEEILKSLQGKISERDMSYMNYLVENENKKPKDVALDFLEKNSLL